jgi:hypothetical protein
MLIVLSVAFESGKKLGNYLVRRYWLTWLGLKTSLNLVAVQGLICQPQAVRKSLGAAGLR